MPAAARNQGQARLEWTQAGLGECAQVDGDTCSGDSIPGQMHQSLGTGVQDRTDQSTLGVDSPAPIHRALVSQKQRTNDTNFS